MCGTPEDFGALFFVFFWFFEIGLTVVAQADLKLIILLPQPPECGAVFTMPD
jgi:hypothetical protein